ncbi:dual specificity protein phosphatase 19-like [Bacillus rossius redtenbacheri]|uniref:dual specificity protein phosphatase 19-like n=1 Tax=Bacillus rossius redtenbacheri TaxID=93214 RepID=UPI002FDD6A59
MPAAWRSPGFVVDTRPDLQVADVLPGLLLGSQDAARDAGVLRGRRVTHVLSLGVSVPPLPGITYRPVDLLDLPDCPLAPVLAPCFSFIDAARGQGCVLVHCNAGVSRSAAVVIGYLIRLGWSYEAAYRHLKERRSAIRPNEGFVRALKLYEKEIAT